MNDMNLLHEKMDLIADKLGAYKIETIGAVIRRRYTRTDGVDVEAVDMYPQWNTVGTFGIMRVCVEYMDHDWQKQRFSQFSGLAYDDLPVYESETAPRRRFGTEHKYETGCQPFRLMLLPRINEDGTNEKTLILRYLPPAAGWKSTGQQAKPPQPRPAQPATKPQATKTAVSPQPDPISPDEHIAYWRKEAMEATDPFMFDTAISKYVLGLVSVESAEATRKNLFGEWNAKSVIPYVVGLETAMNEYHRLDALSADNKGAWKKGKAAGVAAFRKLIEEETTQPGLGIGTGANNYTE